MRKAMTSVCVLATVLTFTAWTSAALVNVAPDATYTYLAGWPGEPGLWGDPGRTVLNNGSQMDLIVESAYEPIIVLFDLGSDKTIAQITLFATETPWNNNALSGCSFFVNTEAQGSFSASTYESLYTASWTMAVSSVDKSNSVWTVDTGEFASPITARYVGLWVSGGTDVNAISEVGIYEVPEPATLAVLAMGGVMAWRRKLSA